MIIVRRRNRVTRTLLPAFIAAMAQLCVFAASASAQIEVGSFDGAVTAGPAPEPAPNPGDPADPANYAPPFTQAGAHPYAAGTTFELTTGGSGTVDSAIKDIHVELPPGLVGNPNAATRCSKDRAIPTFNQALNEPNASEICPLSSIVGLAALKLFNEGDTVETQPTPIYNLQPPPGIAAQFGLSYLNQRAYLDASLRDDGSYGVDIDVRNVNQSAVLLGGDVTLWGNPADSRHDSQRCIAFFVPMEFQPVPACNNFGVFSSLVGPNPYPGDAEAGAFITLPTQCTLAGKGLMTRLRIGTWGGDLAASSFESHDPPGSGILNPLSTSQWGSRQGPTGCDVVPFRPTTRMLPNVQTGDTPTGLNVSISVPTDGLENPAGVAQSDLKKAVVTLPEGMSVNPSSANGLGACSPADLARETADSLSGAGCPNSSKIGTAQIETPLLEEKVEGSVFLAKQRDNPFNSLLAIYIVAKDKERGIVIKLPGKVDPDPNTGRLTATFDDNPQLPFSNLKVNFFGGSTAPLITPRQCGTYEIEADLYPWARPSDPVHSSSRFQVTSGPNGGPCPAANQLNPGFEAGTMTPLAGKFSPLVVNASRPDGSQPLSGINLVLPPGLTGKLAGVPYCPDSGIAQANARNQLGQGAQEIASPSCPSASQVGTVDVGAGAGSTPYRVQGKVYLAGPYRGAPLSLVVITPAVAGPFDLGVVAVRAALRVDPETARISAQSDPIPQILHGIPLKVRSVSVNADRPDFTLNPTNCEPMSLTGALFGPSASASVANRFQVGSCASLPFEPKLKLQLKGATRRGGHPALKAVVTYPAYAGGKDCAALGKRAKRLARKAKRERRRAQRLEAGSAAGLRARKHARDLARKARDLRGRAKRCPLAAPSREANIARAQVGLPHSEFLDQGNLDKVCRQADLNAGSCPKESIYGYAKAWTPLLAEPLQGPVYLGVGFGYKLPALVADLNGQIRILLVGRVDTTKRKGIRNTFEVVPDAPVSRFELRMKGGKRYGLLENSENICKKQQRASALFTGQNGDRLQMRPVIHNSCGKKKGHKPKGHARRR